MRILYNVESSERRRFVRAISEILGEPLVYHGTPSFAYTVGPFFIDRNCVLDYPENIASELVEKLTLDLRERGFIPEVAENSPLTFVVEMPRENFTEEAVTKLQKIIDSKAVLLKKALNTESLVVEITEDKLLFPWFTLHGEEDETKTYTQLVAALCRMAKTQKRVTAKACSTANEKFTLRLFLVRLGFIGSEYKAARRILLQNLTGNSSFRLGYRPSQTAVGAISKRTRNDKNGAAHYEP